MEHDVEMLLKTCRTCALEQAKLIKLFDGPSACLLQNPSIFAEIIALNLKIRNGDGLPQQICSMCLNNLILMTEFRKQCREAQITLETKFKKLKFEIEENAEPSHLHIKTDIDDQDNDDIGSRAVHTEIEMVNVDDLQESEYMMKPKVEPYDSKRSPTSDEKQINKRAKHSKKVKTRTQTTDQKSRLMTNQYQTLEVELIENEERKRANNDEPNEDNEELEFALDSDDKFVPENDSESDSDWSDPVKLPKQGKGKNSRKPKSRKRKPIDPNAETAPCKYCGEQFRVSRQLPRHQGVCKARTTMPCEICTVEFDTKVLLEKHMQELHPDGGPPTCPICSKCFADSAKRNLHMNDLHAEYAAHTCETCGKVFRNKARMKNHIHRYHAVGNKECNVCHEKFSNMAKYRDHVTRHVENMKYKCPYCDKPFYSKFYMSIHERTHTRENPFLCSQCGKSFRTKTRLVDHLRVHDNVKCVPCDICGEKFITAGQMRNHKRSLHNPKSYTCEICDEKFSYKLQYKSHKFNKHNIANLGPEKTNFDNSFPCPKCNKCFAVITSLTKHMKVHTEDRKHVCSHCGNGYKRSDHLTLHIKRMHLGIREHKCPICGKEYLERGAMLAHVKVHSNERPFVCAECPLTFKSNRALRDHTLRHQGQKPYPCGICDMRFFSRTSAVTHTRKVHNDVQKKMISDIVQKEFEEEIGSKQDNDNDGVVVMAEFLIETMKEDHSN